MNKRESLNAGAARRGSFTQRRESFTTAPRRASFTTSRPTDAIDQHIYVTVRDFDILGDGSLFNHHIWTIEVRYSPIHIIYHCL
jgi:hypothetical protein